MYVAVSFCSSPCAYVSVAVQLQGGHMLPTLIQCQECNQPVASGCTHNVPRDQPLVHQNDNSQKKNNITVEELSTVSGLDEDILLQRLAMILRDRNEDLTSIIDTTSPAK